MKTTRFYRGRLPHWEVENAGYFVTCRVANSLPDEAANRIRQLANEARKLEPSQRLVAQRRTFFAMEQWLDRYLDDPVLTKPDVAEIIVEAIRKREADGTWEMLAWVVMPNHIHLFFDLQSKDLSSVMVDYKRWTGQEANRILGRSGQFWQREWFDHWSRTPGEDDSIVEYIRNNPVKAGLVGDYRDWPFGSWSVGPVR